MDASADFLARLEAAFGDAARPEHFTNFEHCEECTAHDNLLRARDRDSLSVKDVENVGWNPLPFCTPEAIAYYLPSLARLALAPPVGSFDWVGDRVLDLLSRPGSDLFLFCDRKRRLAIAEWLAQLGKQVVDRKDSLSSPEEFVEAERLWRPT